jgi:hypothetical protein
MKYIIGPSHIHSDYTGIISSEIESGAIFGGCLLDPHRGLPIWSSYIPKAIEENSKSGREIFWIVSDYKFNNFDYDKIAKIDGGLFLDEMGYPGNVSTDYMQPHHIEVLGNHSLRVIDYMIGKHPDIKLIFWCLYKRTRANSGSSYPRHLWYDEIRKRYSENIIDIDSFETPDGFNASIVDEGAHPNRDGYILLDRMIRSVC